ncbi:IucA/IucC family protein [Ketobacter sp.]|uniref:IucA/IucC family protein n=1 Tax=Ketobacter sp. TaxID=2083498 RepID=UPI000F2B3893|nr:IucA/IucC family protein [Ketobacter sp.]RLU00647.1 MAG: hypothetical protein D9N14_05095 [Ketobacter sp.]
MDTSISDAADYLSANGFINAYLREFDDWRLATSPREWQLGGFPEQVLVIPMGRQTLWVGVDYWSSCGRHRFVMPARCEFVDNGHCRRVKFLCLAKMLVENASLQTNGSIGAMARFLERIIESHRNLEMLLALRDVEMDKLYRQPLSFVEAEQALLAGHAVHPAPKVRQPMTLTEAVQYGPEGGAGFALAWMLVRHERVHYHSADGVTLSQRVQQLIESDDLLSADYNDVPDGYTLIPAHPWQLARLRSLPALQQAFADHHIIALPPQGRRWHATSSMRSLYAEAAPYMLKFSLSVRLTNSVRHLQPQQAARGVLISKALATATGQQFLRRFSQFDILQEPAHVCLLDDAGEPLAESMLVFRENLIREQADRQYNVLAALTQDHPMGEPCRLTSLVQEVALQQRLDLAQAALVWFAAFLDVAIKPLLLAQADYGLLLGAHQQNIVLGLRDGLPVHSYFRDCEASGFSEVGLRLFKLDRAQPGASTHNHMESGHGQALFAYYLIINATFGVISALGADAVIEEGVLVAQLRAFLLQHQTQLRRDRSVMGTLLESAILWQKGNFNCSLADLDENTLAEPLALFQSMENPLCPQQEAPLLQATLIC